LPLHRGDHPVADHEHPDVGRVGLLDELLHQDIDVHALKRLDHRLCRFHRLAKHNPDALGSFEQLDDDWRPADEVDDVLGLARIVGEGCNGKSDAAPREQLKTSQLDARAADGNRLVQGINAHHLELTEHGKTVERHRGADTRNDRVEVVKRPLAVIEGRLARGDVDRDTERIDDLDVVPAGARRLDDAAVAIEMGIARKQRDLHWDSLGGARLLAQQFARP
jgi:hypothetical protein